MATRIEFDASWFDHLNTLAFDALNSLADEIVEDAKKSAPVASGKLRDSIHKGEINQETQSISVVADAPYAGIVEQGSSHMKAQPYLKPAGYKTRNLK